MSCHPPILLLLVANLGEFALAPPAPNASLLPFSAIRPDTAFWFLGFSISHFSSYALKIISFVRTN